MTSPSRSRSWQKLASHYLNLHSAGTTIAQLFNEDPQRFEHFSLRSDALFLDYSKNLLTAETRELLLDLARETGLPDAIKSMYRGDRINNTENRQVLHVAPGDSRCC